MDRAQQQCSPEIPVDERTRAVRVVVCGQDTTVVLVDHAGREEAVRVPMAPVRAVAA